MPFPKPEPGLIISYSYLWYEEYEQGREEGIKDRPCAIVSAVQKEDNGAFKVTVLPVTTAAPPVPSIAVELPLPVKKRLGLDDRRSWVIVSELNQFAWPGPDLRPIKVSTKETFIYGRLSPDLFRKIRDQFIKCARNKNLKSIRRSE